MTPKGNSGAVGFEEAVANRYSAAARAREEALCCPVAYSADLLSVIPEEVLAKDYGCGDPTPYVKEGDTVVDLGAGAGKLCFMLAQVVGASGKVIGVDCNPDMLALSRSYRDAVAERLGFANVDFRNGLIQDLQLDLDRLSVELDARPVEDASDWLALRAIEDRLRRDHPLIPDATVDCVVSNCVLNLVQPRDREQLFAEVFRVLRRGGRAAISDIVADEDVPESLQRDPALWSGCLSGAFREDRFLKAFEAAGFHGIEIVKRQREPWQTVQGIEFRSITVLAHKGKQGPCLERNQAVIYRGPFKQIEDDDGHVYRRGERMAVCDKTFQLLGRPPYTGLFDMVEPRESIPLDAAAAFDCRRGAHRDPRETKGQDYVKTTEATGACCAPGSDAASCRAE
jgi:SAM-dependent methyltransferase